MTQEYCGRGHAWSPQNTYVPPSGYRICRICRKVRAYWRALGRPLPPLNPHGRVGDRLVAALRAHPSGLTTDQLRAALGYCQSPATIYADLSYLRRHHGLPIVAESIGGSAKRYRLERAREVA